MKTTRIVGIDPGSRYTGIGIIDRSGNQLKRVFSTRIVAVKAKTLPDKLEIIYTGLRQILQTYQPDSASIEKIFHSVNPHSSLILGHARGVAMLALTQQEIQIHEYAPTAVKSAVVGAGRASKDQVAAMVQVLLNMDRSYQMTEDESDALAIAICHANTFQFSAVNQPSR
ncbi:MAG: crossover junction endodeoxyribonuclease RuvC [SAR324 cluster bacterium]|uniref:Crossover junction endodeoxyribonuclease RuvC n=1 Tax=SAR324 cluster bacterium TaxID=2024889 RepID=A0A2A4T3T0_9DELT|nr:MAG: crossover junction endodeoxyribonuclease RuvC [SAR324 cluster bacterium]